MVWCDDCQANVEVAEETADGFRCAPGQYCGATRPRDGIHHHPDPGFSLSALVLAGSAGRTMADGRPGQTVGNAQIKGQLPLLSALHERWDRRVLCLACWLPRRWA